MTYIGIDFSLNSPAVVVQTETEEHYYVYYNTHKRYTGSKDYTFDDYMRYNELYLLNNLKGMNLRLRRVIPKELKSSSYVKSFRKKYTNYIDLVNTIMDDLSKYKDNVIVGIEGYSFGSATNTIIDLAECTFHLKNRIITELLNNNVNMLYVFSPSEIKKFTTGKGNANKTKMFDAIMEDKWCGKLCNLVRTHQNEIKNGEKIISPFDDIIDAFFVKEKLKEKHT